MWLVWNMEEDNPLPLGYNWNRPVALCSMLSLYSKLIANNLEKYLKEYVEKEDWESGEKDTIRGRGKKTFD